MSYSTEGERSKETLEKKPELERPPISGWRRTILDEIDRLNEYIPLRHQGEHLRDALEEADAIAHASKIRPSLKTWWPWIWDRITGRENGRYVAALAALFRAREIALLSLPQDVILARLPQFRSDVKRFVDPQEPQFEVYVRLLDHLEARGEPVTDPKDAVSPKETAVVSQRSRRPAP